MNLAEEIVIFQINRGGDFLISRAKKFLEDYSLYEFSKSQLRRLEEIIKRSSDFNKMQTDVTEWIDEQSEREKGKAWNNVKVSLPRVLFQWENHTYEIKAIAKNKLTDFSPITDGVDSLITDVNLRDDL